MATAKKASGKASKAKSKKANQKKGVAGDTSSAATTTLLMPPKKTVVDLAKEASDAKQRMQSTSGVLGKKVSDAVENKHLDRKAFGLARQLAAMDDERLHITYFHLMKYLEDLGVVARATAQGELFESGGAETGEESEEGGEEVSGGDGVVSLSETRAARQVAEAAGA